MLLPIKILTIKTTQTNIHTLHQHIITTETKHNNIRCHMQTMLYCDLSFPSGNSSLALSTPDTEYTTNNHGNKTDAFTRMQDNSIREVMLHSCMKSRTAPHQTGLLRTAPYGVKPRPASPNHHVRSSLL
jgi:hypothetical protein